VESQTRSALVTVPASSSSPAARSDFLIFQMKLHWACPESESGSKFRIPCRVLALDNIDNAPTTLASPPYHNEEIAAAAHAKRVEALEGRIGPANRIRWPLRAVFQSSTKNIYIPVQRIYLSKSF
jgi:hypothetical protein